MMLATFPFVRAVVEPGDGLGAGYVVGAMMTASHARFGARLAESCRTHGLPLALFEVPAVHRSISRHGSDDPRLTKAHFINFLFERYGRSVLYLDVDCVMAQRPDRFAELLEEGVDFAIFNWLAEEHTEAYVRADLTPKDRFYRFSHSIDQYSDTQLLCSGAVQWYRYSDPARQLLDFWQDVIERAPTCADDKSLDLAFNNRAADCRLKAAWLDKSYARYAWWIYQRPVIDHPEFPASGQGFEPLNELAGKPRIHVDALQARRVSYVFPKEVLIDTETRTLLRLQAGAWQAVGSFKTPLWLSPP